MTYLGMQIMVEGLALAAFGFLHQMTTEPLLKQLLRYVMSDEARHVAFGVLSLQEFYQQLSGAEIRERQEFAFEAAVRMRDRFMQQEIWERLGVDVKEAVKAMQQSPERPIFQSMLFSKIVPNCKKLGLLDAGDGWLRERFTELGVIQFEDWADTGEEYADLDEVAKDRAQVAVACASRMSTLRVRPRCGAFTGSERQRRSGSCSSAGSARSGATASASRSTTASSSSTAGSCSPTSTCPASTSSSPTSRTCGRTPIGSRACSSPTRHEDHAGGLAFLLRDIPVPIYGSAAVARARPQPHRGSGPARRHGADPRARRRAPRRSGRSTASSSRSRTRCRTPSPPRTTRPSGTILHSGDFKLDLTPVDGRKTDLALHRRDRQAVGWRQAAAVRLDERRARPASPPSGVTVGATMRTVFRDHPDQRVIVASLRVAPPPGAPGREAAVASGRKVAFLGRSMVQNVALGREMGDPRHPGRARHRHRRGAALRAGRGVRSSAPDRRASR